MAMSQANAWMADLPEGTNPVEVMANMPGMPEAQKKQLLGAAESWTGYQDPHGLHGLGTNSGKACFITTLIFLTIALMTVGMRVWSKQILRRKFLLHDYFVFLGLLFGLGFALIICISIMMGSMGLHVGDATALYPAALLVTAKCQFACMFFWVLSMTFVKLSILHMYMGIFRTRSFLMSSYVLAGCVSAFCVGYILNMFFTCRPLAYNWDKNIPEGSCSNSTVQQVVFGVIQMAIDLAIVVMPMPVIWKLQIPTKKKLVLMGILSVGLCLCIMNITRIVLIRTADMDDFTHNLVPVAIATDLEITISIVIGCLPTFGPLIWRREATSTYNNKSQLGPRKNGMYNQHMMENDFERGDHDDVPLRTIVEGGGETLLASREMLRNHGITVRTDVDVQVHTTYVTSKKQKAGIK